MGSKAVECPVRETIFCMFFSVSVLYLLICIWLSLCIWPCLQIWANGMHSLSSACLDITTNSWIFKVNILLLTHFLFTIANVVFPVSVSKPLKVLICEAKLSLQWNSHSIPYLHTWILDNSAVVFSKTMCFLEFSTILLGMSYELTLYNSLKHTDGQTKISQGSW